MHCFVETECTPSPHFLQFVRKKSFAKEKIPIFALAKSGEIDLARESAFFALFLVSESGQFA